MNTFPSFLFCFDEFSSDKGDRLIVLGNEVIEAGWEMFKNYFITFFFFLNYLKNVSAVPKNYSL